MKFFSFMLSAALLIPALSSSAQDKLKVSGKADFVTDYIWRGMDQNAGFSIQPGLALSYKGFTLSAWGSQSLTNWKGTENDDGSVRSANCPQEFDITLSYNWKNLTVTLTDYWWEGTKSAYGYYADRHHLEGAVSYRISDKVPLTLSWATMLAFSDTKPGTAHDRAFSTYINASYDIACPFGITLTPSAGFTPWKGMYYADGAAFTDIALKAGKSIEVTDKFAIPLFVQTIVAPQADHVYFIAGFSLGF